MKVMRLLAVIAAAAVVACGGPDTPAERRAERARKATGDIVVGAAWPWHARENLLYAQGLEMALDEINAGGGIHGRRIRLVKEDDQETVDQGRVVAKKLSADPDVVAVIGHLESFITVPAAAIYDVAGLLLIAPTSTDPALTDQGYKLVFRTTFNDKQVGRHMAQVSVARGYHRMAIYYMRDRYGKSLANAFEETFSSGGGEVVDRQSYDANEPANPRALDQLVSDWKERDLSAVFIAGEAPQAALVTAAAKRARLTIPVLGGDALGTPELFSSGPAVVEGVTLVSPFHPDDPRAEVRRFDAAFEKRYTRRPDTAAALGYDSLRVLGEAMKQAKNETPADIAAALRALQWAGVTGRFSFADNGDLRNQPLLTVVARKGAFAFLSHGDAQEQAQTRAAAGDASGTP